MRVVKATRQDWKWPLIFLSLGLVGVVVSFLYFFRAFPEASIDLKLSRSEIAQRADFWLRLRGFNPAGFRESVLFDPDEQAKTYLERELGLDEANRRMSSEIQVWRWMVRRFRPPDKEEFVVRLSTTGQLVTFRHLIDENAPGAKLGKDEAQRLAEIFLRTQKGIVLSDYSLVQEGGLEARPNRHDYTFTWERKDFRLKEATYRLSVTVLGDQIGGYREFLKVPEQWSRDYQRLRSRNDLLNTIATFFYLPLIIIAIYVLIRMAQQKRVAWLSSMAIGGVVGAAVAVMIVNQLPTMAAQFPTNVPYSTMVAIVVIGACFAGALAGLFIGLLAGAGQPLYAEMVPGRIRLSRLFTLPGLRSKEFFFSTLIGYGMAAMHIGAVVLFYVVARRFGAWAPLEVNYDNALSTSLPWVYPLAVSLFAATSEEFSFRLFAIPLLHRWLKSRWPAIVIPAFVWGFLHSSYPNQPAWIRGVEVGLIGVLAGWVMLRFGILATLVWHYTVDAVLIGMFLLRSDNLTYRLSGALVGDAVLVPLLVGVVLYWQHGGFLEDESITNQPPARAAAQSQVPSPMSQVGAPAAGDVGPGTWDLGRESIHVPADARRMRVAAIAGLAGLALLVFVKAPALGDFIRYAVTRKQAEQIAVDYLRRSGVDTSRYRRVTTSEQFGGANPEYLRQMAGLAETNRIYAAGGPRLAVWRTRFFRPLEKEEYQVLLAPDGAEPRLRYQRDEKAAGATLALPEAQGRAANLLKQRGVKVDNYNLVESNPEKRPARNDFTFVWESKKALAGEARERIAVYLVGDRIAGPQYTIKVPEAWERQHLRTRLTSLLTPIYIGLLIAAAIVLFAKRMGQATLRWKLYVVLGSIGALLVLLNAPLRLPAWETGYDTSVPWNTEVTQQVIGAAMSAMLAFAGICLLAMAGDTLLSTRFGRLSLLPGPGRARAVYLREALLLGICGGLAARGLQTAARALVSLIPAPYASISVPAVPGISTLWPVGSVLLGGFTSCLWGVLLAGVAAGLAFTWLRTSRWIMAAVALTALVFAFDNSLTPLGYVRGFAFGLVLWGTLAGLAWLLRLNVAAYAVAAACMMLGPALASLARHPAFRSDAWVAGAVLAAGVLSLLLWIRRESARPEPTTVQSIHRG